MKQLTILAFFPSILQEHQFKHLPQCISCQRKFTEKEFSKLQSTGHNIVWNINYAKCSDCGKEVQGWRRLA